MFNVGDIVEIIPTEDDGISQRIAGSVAKIVAKERSNSLVGSFESYNISFINLKDDRYKAAVGCWQPKNLRLQSIPKETDINESDIMDLLSGE